MSLRPVSVKGHKVSGDRKYLLPVPKAIHYLPDTNRPHSLPHTPYLFHSPITLLNLISTMPSMMVITSTVNPTSLISLIHFPSYVGECGGAATNSTHRRHGH